MKEYNVFVTWEAIYDITDIAEYIEIEFGQLRADRFQDDIQKQFSDIAYLHHSYPKTEMLYRGYFIHKKSFSPSIIFYIIKEDKKEVHILRVLREERDWGNILSKDTDYSYPS
ncbi:MAG: type II toxin-antitoxin system RelE/ParE family toxin [Lachnospiraceae bacterium]|nr:type II toxin-antitoxin system RelE/ParE family toxin [Lachnospiraceae bacterium]